MRILIVNRYMALYGGAETVVRELAVRLKQRGDDVRIVTLNISDAVRERCGSVEVVTPSKYFPYKFRSTDVLAGMGILDEIVWMRRLVRSAAAGCDVINVHNFPADWVAGGLKKPVAWMCNEVPDFYNNPRPSAAIRMLRSVGIALDKAIVRRQIDSICVADEFNAAKVRERYDREPQIIPYGIEYDFFSVNDGGADIKNEYGLRDSFMLLQVGMLSHEKNQMKSLEAVDRLRKEFPNIRLVLAGRPQSPYDHILKDYVEERNLQHMVVFTGHISKEKVRSLYHACDVALFPVRSQGGWLSPFEALSAAKPIISSTTMGAASVISRERLGIVSDDIVEAVKTVHDGYAFYECQAQRAREWVRENLTWDSYTNKMRAVFEKLAAGA